MPRFDEPTWHGGYSPQGREYSLDEMMRALPLTHAARKQYDAMKAALGERRMHDLRGESDADEIPDLEDSVCAECADFHDSDHKELGA